MGSTGVTSPLNAKPLRGRHFERKCLAYNFYHQDPMDDLPKLWESIKADLRRARNLLPNCLEDQHDLSRYYEEFLEHNELELGLRCT